MELTIIIPARDEEDVVLKTLKTIDKKVKVPHKVVVVNDFSEDGTEKVIEEYSKKNNSVIAIRNTPRRKGFAGALQTGIEIVDEGAVVIVMADSCDDPNTINLMYKKLQEGWDAACGSRYMKGGRKTGGPRLQGFFSNLVCWSLHRLTGIPTKDTSNAFKMYRREVLDNVVFNPESGVEASMEIVLQTYFNGAKITEIPTSWEGRKVGQSKFKMLQRTPRYFRIFCWAIENSIRKSFFLKLKPFYSK